MWFEDRGQSLVKYAAGAFEPPSQVAYRLKRNVRNSTHVAEYANNATSNPAIPSDIPGHVVKSYLYKTPDELGRFLELEAAVSGLIKKGFKAEDIVLLDYSGNNETLMEAKKIAGLAAFGWSTSARRNVIRYTTVRKFKGMEAPAVIVYNVKGCIEKDDPLFYVAATRPKVSLTIMADQTAMESISKMMIG